VKIAIGTIIEVKDFPRAKKPAFQLLIDFGDDIGIKKSSAQITTNYTKEQLLNRQIAAVVNFEPKNIAGFTSEVLVLGAALPDSSISLLNIDHVTPNGTIITEHIQQILEHLFPETPIPLAHKDAYTLLIAVLLSAQCTDERVNQVTPTLFALADTPSKMSAISVETIQSIIRPCGLSPTKAKAILRTSQILEEQYQGLVPPSFEALEKLPGVGHKTASVVMSQAFGQPAFPVDTHIHRLAQRWGLSEAKNVVQTENDLKVTFPEHSWNKIHLQMIFFGRKYCPARGHDPQKCPICSIYGSKLFGVITIIVGALLLIGLRMVNPNSAKIFTLFGEYVGTVNENGLIWVNPFYTHQNISLRARNFDSQRVKVNDKRGNPIQISAILVWKVADTFKAAFEVDNYDNFVKVQTEAAVRHLAASYSYDNFADDTSEITLRSSFEEVNHALANEIRERLSMAGINVLEARIGYLAYAEEIASAMLRRQQAEAIVSARFKIVEGAVSMVELALADLSKRAIIDLDEDKKAAMKKFVLRIDESTMEAIEKWAADEFRSTNGQIEWMLTTMLQNAGRHPKPERKKKPNKA
ncbi:unnamed protein product, partial [Darwinula stevensoni]